MKNCLKCGKELEGQHQIKFCSNSCAVSHNNTRKGKKYLSCEHCKCEFYKNGKYYKFCSVKCSGEHKIQETTKKNLDLFSKGLLKKRQRIYEILVKRDGNICAVCKLDANHWEDKPLRLWVDHIDGNASNNAPENFRLICPNCESQTDTSRGKNLGKGRKSRGLACYD